MATKDPITCHILDTTAAPAKGVKVKLEGGHAPLKTFESQTDEDGRIKSWLACSASEHEAGDVPIYTLEEVLGEVENTSTWTLRFYTEPYFGEGNTFFPEVVVVFKVQKGQHYHVPLLLSPYSYSTYRGS
ncbi:hypothetical protein G7054_g8715 [Neopestalotiopsis clavispora]|nr:hypothetical protein G7054_g8715 [Neopestalotiopsis clavispora]